MSFNKTYFLYVGLIVGIPTLVIALISSSTWWTFGVFVFSNVLACLVISIFHLLFCAIGDKSNNSKINTALRLL